MNKLRKLIMFFSIFTLVNCGSSERIITEEGKVYEVKGSTIKKEGVDVTENLSNEEKKSINNLLAQKKEAREIYEAKHKAIEDAISKQKKIQKDARENQKKLENDLSNLEDSLKEKQNARDNYATVKSRYTENKVEFQELKKAGTLSPNDIIEWKEKLNILKAEVKQAKRELN